MIKKKILDRTKISLVTLICIMNSAVNVYAGERQNTSSSQDIDSVEVEKEPDSLNEISSVEVENNDREKIQYNSELALTRLGGPDTDVQIPLSARGSCVGKKKITALLPQVPQTHLNSGLTIDSRPTFWFYIPYEKNNFALKFAIDRQKNDENQIIYATDKIVNFSANLPGIIKFQLSPNSPSLQAGKTYNWKLSFYCKAASNYSNYVIQGQIKRIIPPLALENELKQPKAIDNLRERA